MKPMTINQWMACSLLTLGSFSMQSSAVGQENTDLMRYGVTFESVEESEINQIIESLAKLPKKMTVRVVFQDGQGGISETDPQYYRSPVQQIHAVSYVMGQILDSEAMSKYSADQFEQRTKDFFNLLGNSVDVWEIGNEVNGQWLVNVKKGENPAVTGAKILKAYHVIKNGGGKTALTLYYNGDPDKGTDCWDYDWESMFPWAAKYVSDEMKQGLDYVLISYYEADCNNYDPGLKGWQTVFDKLATMFPNAKIGFGESGTTTIAKKATYLTKYYSFPPFTSNYIGGYFWWYGNDDIVPYSKKLNGTEWIWGALCKALDGQSPVCAE